MLRAGGGVTGGSSTGGSGSGARVAGGAVVVGAAAARVARVVVGRGAVVDGVAAVVVVGAAVVVVLNDVEVDDRGTGRSAAATCRVSAGGAKPAGEAPAQVEAPTSTTANSGLARTGLMTIARIGG
jgi:hypothetical protein